MEEIKMFPVIAYNQYQAYSFGLNHTQAIIMNYMTWLPQWADQHTIEGKKYYLAYLSKGLKDLPTLEIKKNTLRSNINVLIEKKLLKRMLIDKNKPVYRVTDKWMLSNPAAVKKTSLSDVKKAIGTFSSAELAELNKELSSYKVKGASPMEYKFTNSLSGGLSELLQDRLPSLNIDLRKRTMCDEDIVDIKDFIVSSSVDMGLIAKEANGQYSASSINKVVGVVKAWANHHGARQTIIKNIKASLNTRIGNYIKFNK